MNRIVVADDDIDIADLYAYSLEVAGHTVHTAVDGVSALQLVRQFLPDLVVLDQNMPGLTGLEVAAALRSDSRTADLPILMVTANGPKNAAALVDRLLTKPLAPRQLLGTMRDMLPHT